MTFASARPIVLPLPTPLRVGTVNAYLLPGDEPALVDTGPNAAISWEALLRGLDEQGVGPRDLRHVFITHAHIDHYGNAARLAEAAPEAIFYAPDLAHARPMLLDLEEEWARQSTFMERALVASGVPSSGASQAHTHMAELRALGSAVPVTRWVQPGEWLAFGEGQRWQVVALPGHSMTQVGLHQPEQAWFLAADHLLPHISSNALLEPPAPGEARRPHALPFYMESLRASADLPVQQVFPGHGIPFVDQRPLIARRLDEIEARAATLRVALQAQPREVIGLVHDLFPRLHPSQLFLAVSEVVGHLDLLEARGQVAWQGETVRRYHAC